MKYRRRNKLVRPVTTVILVFYFMMISSGPSGARPVWACFCAYPKTPKEAFDQASAVFIGEVTYVSKNFGLLHKIRNFLHLNNPYENNAIVKVINSWKGVEETEVNVRTLASICGVQFSRGQEYLFYTYEDDGLETNYCTGTIEVSAASAVADLNFLAGKPTLPLHSRNNTSVYVAVVSGGVLVIVVGVFFLSKQRKGR